MEAFDTNVVVRLMVRDDEEQYRRAELAFRRATAAGGAWIGSVVLVEVSWVLRVAYKFDRPTIAAALGRLLATAGVQVEDQATTLLALAAFEAGSADFAGLLHPRVSAAWRSGPTADVRRAAEPSGRHRARLTAAPLPKRPSQRSSSMISAG